MLNIVRDLAVPTSTRLAFRPDIDKIMSERPTEQETLTLKQLSVLDAALQSTLRNLALPIVGYVSMFSNSAIK